MNSLSYSFACSYVRGCTDPLVLKLDTREDCVITFMNRPLPPPLQSPKERSFSVHLILGLVNARNRLVELEERKISYT